MIKAIKTNKTGIVKIVSEFEDILAVPKKWIIVPTDEDVVPKDKYKNGTVIKQADHEGYITELTKQQYNILFLPYIFKINQAINVSTEGMDAAQKQVALTISATVAHMMKILDETPQDELIDVQSTIVESMLTQLVSFNVLLAEDKAVISKGLAIG